MEAGGFEPPERHFCNLLLLLYLQLKALQGKDLSFSHELSILIIILMSLRQNTPVLLP